MAPFDFAAPRLFLEHDLEADAHLALSDDQRHYLAHVLRLKQGDAVLVFNGRDGEWRARLAEPQGRSDRARSRGAKHAMLVAEEAVRSQTPLPDLHYLFAPLKHARLDYMVQKAVEMGAGRLQPVLTRRTNVSRLNGERLRANAIEAAEQCGILSIPDIRPERSLANVLADWETGRALVFCDEEATGRDPVADLRALPRGTPTAVLIGPEGGFDDEERQSLLARQGVIRLSLGPRILRADTAAVAALTLVGAILGDWL